VSRQGDEWKRSVGTSARVEEADKGERAKIGQKVDLEATLAERPDAEAPGDDTRNERDAEVLQAQAWSGSGRYAHRAPAEEAAHDEDGDRRLAVLEPDAAAIGVLAANDVDEPDRKWSEEDDLEDRVDDDEDGTVVDVAVGELGPNHHLNEGGDRWSASVEAKRSDDAGRTMAMQRAMPTMITPVR
jgi:hypothetical protein